MKSPDEIKKGLRCPAWVRNHHLPCSECDYHGRDKPPCAIAVHEDALAYIQQLEAQNAELLKQIEELKAGKARAESSCTQMAGMIRNLRKQLAPEPPKEAEP